MCKPTYRLKLLRMLCGGLMALTLLAVARPVSAMERGPQWRRFTVDDGLAANDVWAVLQAQDGALWFGTNGGGVSRFDGRWTLYSVETTDGGLAGNQVRSILQASDGSLWFGTSQGLSRTSEGAWSVYRAPNELPGNEVWALAEVGDGLIWAGTDAGLAGFDGRTWRRLTSAQGLVGIRVRALWRDRQGLVWVGTDGGVNYCDLGSQPSCIVIEELRGVEVNAIQEDREGRVWLATASGVWFYDGSVWKAFGGEAGLGAAPIIAIAQDHEGLIWLGSDGAGVARYYGEQLVATITSADGLPSDNVRSIIRDRDGALWFGTLGGVGRHDWRTWQSYHEGQPIMGIARGPWDEIWAGTAESGLRHWDGRAWQDVTVAAQSGSEGLPSDWVEVLYRTADSALWVGTPGYGLARFDGSTWQVFTRAEDGLSSDVITAIYQTTDGTLWVGTDSGLCTYDGRTWRALGDEETRLAGDLVLAMAQDGEGTLWVGGRGGLSRYDGQRWLEPYTTANSTLAADEVRALLPTGDGSMWVGTWAGGVNQIHGDQWRTYTVADGLAANGIFSIAMDSRGALWFGTISGLTRYDGVTWLSYTTADGLLSNIVLSMYAEPNGVIWIGTEGGLNRYEPDTGFPVAHVLSANGQPYEGGAVTAYSGGTLDIQFDGGDLRTPRGDLVFLCYLEGIQPGWGPCERFALSALPRGRYTFHLTARDEDFNYAPPLGIPVRVRWGLRAPGGSLVVPGGAVVGAGVALLAGAALLTLYVASGRRPRRTPSGALKRRFNPYISGEPIRRSDMFFGRDEMMERILPILHANSVMIHGERRIGKTTFLYQLANRLRGGTDPQYAFVPVSVDLQGTTEEAFFRTLMEDTVRACTGLLPAMPKLIYTPRSDQPYGDRDFGHDLSGLIEALQKTTDKEIRVILLIDEMDVIDTYGSMVQLQLRRIFMTDFARNLGAVVAGVQLSKKWDRPESPWYNLFHEVAMPPFTDAEARELITQPVRGIYTYSEQALQRIIVFGKGRPHRIQRYCLEAVNHMLSQDRTRVTLEDVEAAHRTITQG